MSIIISNEIRMKRWEEREKDRENKILGKIRSNFSHNETIIKRDVLPNVLSQVLRLPLLLQL